MKLNDRPRRLEHDRTDLGGGHGYAQRGIAGRLFDNVSGVEGIRRKKGGKMEGLKEYILKEDAVAAVMETDPHVFLTYNKKKEKTEIVVAQITEEVLEEINKIPAADVEPRWIPVTERLPEEHEEVLTYDSVFGITFDSIHNGKWRKHPEAWMPLPEPYKGGEEE